MQQASLPKDLFKQPAFIFWLFATILLPTTVWGTYFMLPPKIATHFNAVGVPNGWMPLASHATFTTILGIGVPLFLSGIFYCPRFCSPETLSVPNAAYWHSPEHYPEACDFLFTHSFWFTGAMTLFFNAIHFSILAANLQSSPLLSSTFAWLPSGILIITLIPWLYFMLRFFNNPSK